MLCKKDLAINNNLIGYSFETNITTWQFVRNKLLLIRLWLAIDCLLKLVGVFQSIEIKAKLIFNKSKF